MISLRRAEDRGHVRRPRHEVWLTFSPENRAASFAKGFGVLATLNEDRFAPGADVVIHLRRDAEILTYVREGSLAHDDSTGRSGIIYAGEFQRVTAGGGTRHGETNASRSEWAHVFQILLRPPEKGLEPSREQRRFSAAERRGGLCVVASPDGRDDSLLVHEDAVVYSALLDPGQHVVHELTPKRGAWVHVVCGEVTLDDFVLTTGDGAAVTESRSVSLTANAESEVLLVDLLER